MANTEIHSTTEKAIAFRYQSLTTTSGQVTLGGIVDSVGFEALEFVMQGGVLSSGITFSEWKLVLLEGDTNLPQGIFLPVDPEFLITSNDEITLNNQEISVGYIGKKRFVFVTIKRTGGAAFATIDSIGVAVLGAKGHHVPAIPPTVIFP